ncbi:MAG: sulfate adenylyltransferase subunit CysN [Edaphobacter sp.]|uniref:sulfate adenylyltransferase subunit CysN n=1 Tax=Edaphobacter sp. TaxID=1934404 RepID=UPI00239A4306|nr:sulfate adenylyltransferase subunit CysN [Edaphobacter sp.]MDE1177801.1 sulfate adenylyltransferase subunit CysN [Edaphobacter sp.]
MANDLLHTEREFQDFLDAHLGQELLRFTTAGSVDDGKSTLIGRLLHDTKSVYEDQLAAVKKSRVNRAANGHVDFSLLTDGLKAEREQGITIDVAYRYFSTSRRKFIIADTPGHEQYTRNMATGASTADVAVVLIDAKAFLREGKLLPQSRRHTYIASLLGIPHVVAAVNKMDIVGYSQETFQAIRAEFVELASRLGLKSVTTIPVSALEGDNVVTPSTNMTWYDGPTLLEFLETVPLLMNEPLGPLRFPVQLVQRPDASFRGFAGQVARGVLRAGERVRALPSGRETTVSRIVTWDGDLPVAAYPQSVTVELEDEIDLSRGEMLVAASAEEEGNLPQASRHVRAMVVWMHEEPLVVGRTYIAKHTTRTVRATVKAIRYRVDVATLEHGATRQLAMNEIAEIELETNLPLFFDPYEESRTTGSMILIDSLTNATVGAAMITGASKALDDTANGAPALVLLPGRPAIAERLREQMEAHGYRAVVIDDDLIPEESLVAVIRALDLAGVTAITSRALASDAVDGLVHAVSGFTQRGVLRGDELDDEKVLEIAGGVQ